MKEDSGDASGPGTREPSPQAVSAVPASPPIAYRNSWPRRPTPCDLTPIWKGEFCSFGDWVNFATKRLTHTYDTLTGREIPAICIDSLGRRCTMGAHFMRARDEGAFPVRYFWECESAQGIVTGTAETSEAQAPVPKGLEPGPKDAP